MRGPRAGKSSSSSRRSAPGTAALEELPRRRGGRRCSDRSATPSRPRTCRAGARVAIVAGGIGAAPFPLLFRALARAGIAGDLFLGGRSAADLALPATGSTASCRARRFSRPTTVRSAKRDSSRRSSASRARRGPLRAGLRLRSDADVRRAREGHGGARRAGRVLDRSRDGMRVRRVPGLRDPGRREAVPRLLLGRPDPVSGEDPRGERRFPARPSTVRCSARSTLQNPDPHRERDLRVRPRVHRLRGPLAARRALHEGTLPEAPCRQPAAAHLRDARRDAERDRPAERRRRGVPRRQAAEAARAAGATVIANVWGDLEEDYVTVVARARGGRRARGRRAEHLLPERGAGRNALRQLARAHGVARREGARRDASGR